MNKFESKYTGQNKDDETNFDWIRQKLEKAEKSGISNASKEDIIVKSMELLKKSNI